MPQMQRLPQHHMPDKIQKKGHTDTRELRSWENHRHQYREKR